ncbi:hypothetical protein [Streptomyces sp. NPDC101455]|uniref:hypothetical protein n=1 Tax=Streptomyces sp. NPDC101455 TaxID=3366142 RepID=UPI0037F13E74
MPTPPCRSTKPRTRSVILQASRALVDRPGYMWLLVGALLVVIAGVTTMLITLA